MMRSRDDDEAETPEWKLAAYAVATAGLVAFFETFARRAAERLFGKTEHDDEEGTSE